MIDVWPGPKYITGCVSSKKIEIYKYAPLLKRNSKINIFLGIFRNNRKLFQRVFEYN